MLFYTDFQLENSNTFNISAKADFYYEIASRADIDAFVYKRKYFDMKRLILGNGSNVLFTKDFDGVVLKNNMKGVDIITENDDEVIIKVASGENFDDFAALCARKRYCGIENLSGIPGTVGGAAVQNIGAYGQEIKNLISEVEYYSFDNYEINTLKTDECQFGYRSSIFKTDLADKIFITAVTFKLSKKFTPNISYGNLQEKLGENPILTPAIIRRTIIATRDEKIPNPKEFGNAGSFFKNPEITSAAAKKLKEQFPELKQFDQPNGKVKLSAGQLIDLCGFKQMPDPNVSVANNNALIMINLGNATGKEIVAYSKKIQKAVKEKFGVKIEPEVVFV